MEWLNYHHLYYFSVIASEGGVASAARTLRLSHSTLSTQLGALEEHFGGKLFERRSRRLVLTPLGTEVAGYAQEIFRLGRELNEVARGRARPGRRSLRVGVVAGIPKTVIHRLLAPAVEELGEGAVVIEQESPERLVESLAAGRLQVVLTSSVPTAKLGARIHAHPLGETEILLYGRPSLVRRARRRFPQSLDGLPAVLPDSGSPLRRRLDEWFAQQGVELQVKAEVADAGLLRVLGGAGWGIFPARAALKTEVEDLRDVELLGPCTGVREQYFALTPQRRIQHPALQALISGARAQFLAPQPSGVRGR